MSGGAGLPRRNHLISRKSFRDFVRRHPSAERDSVAFAHWGRVVERALWSNFADVRATFNTADQVGDRVVFNVGGNKYRVVARINYQSATVFIRHVLTHTEYDSGVWKANP
jgi:mRNA interferase HigB